jgi:nucleoside-diphosphate-sugar epimerase
LTDLRARGADFNAFPAHVWNTIRGGSLGGRVLFITGATGFAGSWLLAAIARLNARLSKPLAVRALTRLPRESPEPWLTWVVGDVRDFRDDAPADLVLHAALPSTATPAGGEAELSDTARRGIDAVMAHVRTAGASRAVVLSSGAVYGSRPGPVSESVSLGAPDAADAYAAAKRDVESRVIADARAGLDVVIARLFTCIGPGYRNHGHLAHVSLFEDAKAGRALTLLSDGKAVRSYLYGADLAVWLLTLLCGTGSDIVNVGSDVPMTVYALAQRIARASGRQHEPVVTGPGRDVRRPYFVPDISHARTRYRLAPWTTVELAIARTLSADSPGAGPK